MQHYVELEVDGVHLVLCHYPFRSWNRMTRAAINLHGHSHGRLKPIPRQMDAPEMHDAAKDFQAAFIVANLDPLRALPILRVPGTGREPDLSERQLDARRRVHDTLQALGGISSPAGSCVWHVVGLQRSVREWALRQGWGGRPVRQEQAQGILIAALGMLAAHVGYGEARRAS